MAGFKQYKTNYREMKRLIPGIKNWFMILVLFQVPFNLFPQASETDTTKVEITPILLTEITVEIPRAISLLQEKREFLLKPDEKSAIVNRLDTLTFRLKMLREDERIHKLDVLSFRNLASLENDWNILNSLLTREQTLLLVKVQDYEKERSALEKMHELWEKTLTSALDLAAPGIVIDQITSTVNDIESLLNSFKSDSEFLQGKLVEISEWIIFSNSVIGQIKSAQQIATRQLLSRRQSPLWREFSQKTNVKLIHEQRSLVDDTVAGLKDFYRNYTTRIWLNLIAFLIILVIVFFLFSNLKHNIPEKDLSRDSALYKILSRPVSSAFLITYVLTFIIFEIIPDSVRLFNTLILFIPVILILGDIITGSARKYIYFPIIAALLVQIHSLSYSDTLISRIFLLVIILFSLVVILSILLPKSHREYVLSARMGKYIYTLLWLMFGLMSASLVSVIIGAVLLAEFLTYASLRSTALALILFALSVALNSVIIALLHSKRLQAMNLIKQHYNIILKRMFNAINFITIVLWIIFTLRYFNFWDDIYGGIKKVLTYNLTVGTLNISPGDILIFGFIIWLTLWISSIIRIIFDEEVAPKVKLKRGVPGAISLIIRISLITIGFLIAIAAAGVEMSKLAILFGALGVGIGFGLQNIFNNLVSGIILAFERPLNEGDIIEVGSHIGIVKQIGIRASTIRTAEGAEVIVPNGNLIANELINWTLTDQQRRAEVTVGVGYGTNPEQVLEILRSCAHAHPEVLKDPEPLAIFTAFGSSSLDFRLLFWIPNADRRLIIQSDVAILVNDALQKARIEIPFPQQDLHVKSIDSSITSNLMIKKETQE
jgi:potassium efflux system protein